MKTRILYGKEIRNGRDGSIEVTTDQAFSILSKLRGLTSSATEILAQSSQSTCWVSGKAFGYTFDRIGPGSSE